MSKEMTVGEAIKRINEFALHHAIKELPNSARTVEAFEMAITALEVVSKIVTCGECEYHGEPHRTDMGVDVVWCNFYNTHKLKDGYCNCGERKGGAE